MGSIVNWLDRRFYPGVSDNWDDTLLRKAVQTRLTPASTILDLGAGAGILPQMNFKGIAARICGLDPDPRVLENPYLDEAKVGTGSQIPYDNAEFDLVVADNVLEHLSEPAIVFREVCRVLKPGGYFITKTPNRSHYVPSLSRSTPLHFHKFYNYLRGRDPEDTFPTYYRANTARKIKALAAESSFEIAGLYLTESRPEYLRLNAALYLCGIGYERLVNASSALANFRVILLVELRKPS
jgi:SAM-dependent methyltransferase